MASVSTMSECSITRLEKASVLRVLQNEPSFSAMFLHYLLSRNIRVEEDLVDHLFNSSESGSHAFYSCSPTSGRTPNRSR